MTLLPMVAYADVVNESQMSEAPWMHQLCRFLQVSKVPQVPQVLKSTMVTYNNMC